MAYNKYGSRGGRANDSDSVGFGDSSFDDILNQYAPGGGGGGYEDPYRRPYNDRSDPPYQPSRNGADPYSRAQDPPYSRGGKQDLFYGSGGGELDESFSGGRPVIDDPILRNPYIRNNSKPDLNRRSGLIVDGLDRRGGHYRTDSYETSLSSTHLDTIYSTPMNRNSALIMRSPPAIYTLDHLATFAISQKQRLLTPEDGMHQLRRMEKTTGVWTMRIELRIDEREIVVTETSTQKEIESFPISYIHNPVSIRSNDKEEVYNNIVIFTVQGEGGSAAEMNVFQCIGVSAQEVVDDINAARTGKFPRQKKIPPPVTEKPKIADRVPSEPRLSPPPVQREPSPLPSPAYNGHQSPPPTPISKENQKQAEQLNSCFDDIERFVSDIQKAAAANNEYERKKAEGAPQADIDYYKQRSQPPSTEEYVVILQKFKYAFNLLPRLKGILRDPGVEELVKSLFSPLTLVLNSSRDSDGKLKLADSVISPLLTLETCRLMDLNLEPRDKDLWQSIGDSWSIPEERWQGPPASPYVPEFDGLKKAASPQPLNGDLAKQGGQNGEALDPQKRFLNELKSRNCKVCQVMNSRSANPQSSKELTVTGGEYLEILNDEKNWWKVRNIRNEQGFAPKTILNPLD